MQEKGHLEYPALLWSCMNENYYTDGLVFIAEQICDSKLMKYCKPVWMWFSKSNINQQENNTLTMCCCCKLELLNCKDTKCFWKFNLRNILWKKKKTSKNTVWMKHIYRSECIRFGLSCATLIPLFSSVFLSIVFYSIVKIKNNKNNNNKNNNNSKECRKKCFISP